MNKGKIKLTFEGKKYSDIVLEENKGKVNDYIE
jgi:hypothetical protein